MQRESSTIQQAHVMGCLDGHNNSSTERMLYRSSLSATSLTLLPRAKETQSLLHHKYPHVYLCRSSNSTSDTTTHNAHRRLVRMPLAAKGPLPSRVRFTTALALLTTGGFARTKSSTAEHKQVLTFFGYAKCAQVLRCLVSVSRQRIRRR